ncbi:MAG: FkbM family methyltransferase [Frankia sp.]
MSATIRSLAERATHGVTIRRHLPAPFGSGTFLVSTEGGLKYLRRSLDTVDPVLVRLAGEVVKPGDVVWDVGANLGLFSFCAASRAGRSGAVVALEPDVWLVRLLRRSARGRVTGAPVEVVPVALSDRVGISRFHIARRSRATSHIEGFGTDQAGGTRAVHSVPTTTLDHLLDDLPTPNVVKIDVEGAEALVLAGARRMLRSARPTVICEVFEPSADRVAASLAAADYVVFDADRFPCADPVSRPPLATLALPRERIPPGQTRRRQLQPSPRAVPARANPSTPAVSKSVPMVRE